MSAFESKWLFCMKNRDILIVKVWECVNWIQLDKRSNDKSSKIIILDGRTKTIDPGDKFTGDNTNEQFPNENICVAGIIRTNYVLNVKK